MTRPTVLVVEDNELARKLVRVTLEPEGYTVLECESARGALERVAEAPPDLILQDLVLPDLNGLELVHALRALPGGANLPILALTGFLMRGEAQGVASAAAFDRILVKPIEPSALLEVVASYLPCGKPAQPVGAGRHLLLADDDRVQRKLTRLLLEQLGFSVTAVEDGQQALARAFACPPDAIVSDVLMPGLDGFQLCLAVRNEPRLAHIPVLLASSSYISDDDRAHAIAVGAHTLVVRTPDLDALTTQLLEMLASPVRPLGDQPQVLERHHGQRIQAQLERQSALVETLRQRSVLGGSTTAVVSGLTAALATRTERSLDQALYAVLDVCGVEHGAIFLDEAGGRRMVAAHGIEEAASVAGTAGQVTVIPIGTADQRIGELVLGTGSCLLEGEEWTTFTRFLGAQLGQAIALAQAHATAVAAQNRCETLLENAHDAIFVLDSDEAILQVNRAAEEMLGLPRAALSGRRLSDIVTAEGGVRRADGSEVIVTLSSRIVELDGARSTIAIAHDVTRKMQALRALEVSEERYRTLLHNLPDVVWTADATGRPIFASENATQVLGVTPEELCAPGSPVWFERIHPEDRPKVQAAYTALLARGEPMDVVQRVLHSDGRTRWIRGRATSRYDRDGVMHVDGVSTDVTARVEAETAALARELEAAALRAEQKKMQEQLMISDRMASMGTLAAGVAHEINNPLACVLANLELAERDLSERAEDLPPGLAMTEIREEVQDARRSSERIRDIVRDLKIFSRAEEEKTGPVDLQRVMESTLRMAWNEIRHRARLVKHYGKTPPVEATESRLGQVFLNLVVNAAQAISEGRAKDNEIRISTAVSPNGVVVVEIADTGTGMPREVLDRLFTPFFTTKPIGVGTGLGLSICHRIVTDFGGSLEVESAVGQGTTFRISLPAARGEASAAAQKVALGSLARRRGRILVVDDEPLLVRVVERTLAGEHDVVALSSADEALERIQAGERFDVILCDLIMPQRTGMDLHTALFRLVREQADRMVFLSGGAFTVRARRFLAEIPNPCIEKPFDALAMKKLVNDRIR